MMEDTYDYALKSDPVAEELTRALQSHRCYLDDMGFDEMAGIISNVLAKSDAVYIRLTPREAEILRRMLRGAGVKELGKHFGVTMARVKNILERIERKIYWYQERYRARIAAQEKRS